MKKYIIIGLVLVAIGVAVYFLFFLGPGMADKIVIPYIAHQRPTIDPHLPASDPLSDKLDEVQFEGLFNISANPSGIVYNDGLGEFVSISPQNVITIRLKTRKQWHDSYRVATEDKKVKITKESDHNFSAEDLRFTLKRIQSLGSLSPDYILVAQALRTFDFEGPDANGEIKFKFFDTRIWTEPDIKEVLSFKIIPANSQMNALSYTIGTKSYLAVLQQSGVPNYIKKPDGIALISNVVLAPFVDNSTFATEMKNKKINLMLETPFGAESPILQDGSAFFPKSNTSTVFFAILFNIERLNKEQRIELKKLLDNKALVDRFYKVGTPQQRHIVDFRNNRDNYADYLNRSVFPATSYYIEEKIIPPAESRSEPNIAILPDTVRIKACVNFGFREEYQELIDILNDPALFRGKIRATAVSNDDIRDGKYDAVLVAFSGYRSNFLFDLYNVFLREPNLETYKINLQTEIDQSGKEKPLPGSMQANKNFFHMDPVTNTTEAADIKTMLQYVHGFMSTRNIGDKQAYALRVHDQEQKMALGSWLFSLPSLAYFSKQFDSTSIDLYGVASQLSTIEKWKEMPKK
jgi:hypothetical protein